MRRPPLVSYDTYPHPWVTPAELAAFLGCDERTITRMIASRSLTAFRLGRRWCITLTEARRAFPVERHPAAS